MAGPGPGPGLEPQSTEWAPGAASFPLIDHPVVYAHELPVNGTSLSLEVFMVVLMLRVVLNTNVKSGL